MVTVNYNGYRKFLQYRRRQRLHRRNTNLVSPVQVGENAYIAAGSTITDDVPAGDLAIARARQVEKAGWVEGYRAKELALKEKEKNEKK